MTSTTQKAGRITVQFEPPDRALALQAIAKAEKVVKESQKWRRKLGLKTDDEQLLAVELEGAKKEIGEQTDVEAGNLVGGVRLYPGQVYALDLSMFFLLTDLGKLRDKAEEEKVETHDIDVRTEQANALAGRVGGQGWLFQSTGPTDARAELEDQGESDA